MPATEVIYRMTFDDYVENECCVLIKQSGYAGAETEVKGGTTPVVIRMMAEGDSKFTHIKATEAVIQLISTTSLQYLSLFTSPNKTYHAEVFCGVNRVWTGWVNPEYYVEPFQSPPYPITITATDGIAELKNITFPVPTGTFKKSVIYYIANCLKQIGLPQRLPLKVGVNISANTTDGIVTSRIFENLFIDYRSFRDGYDMWSCYDILNEILSSFNARLYLWNDAWHIERIDQKYTAYDIDNYDDDGLYTSTTNDQNDVVALTAHSGVGTDIRFINTPAMLEVQPAYKGFNIHQEYGQRTNILPFSNFEGKFADEDFVNDNTLRYWDQASGVINAPINKVTVNDESYLLMKPVVNPDFDAYIWPIETGSPLSHYTWTYNEGSTDEDAMMLWLYGYGTFIFEWDAYPNYAHYKTDTLFEPRIKIKILCNCSGNVYAAWFDEQDYTNYKWVNIDDPDPELDHSYYYLTLPKGEWSNFRTVFEPPLDEYGVAQTYVGFNILIGSPDESYGTASSDGILYNNLKLYFSDERDSQHERTLTYSIDDDNLLEPETYEVKYGDTPDPFVADGAGLVNKYVLFDSDGKAVNKFGITTNTPPYPLPNYSLVRTVLQSDLNNTFRYPLFKLRGAIIDTTTPVMNIGSILKDYNNRYYFATGLAYDVKECTYEGEWLQMYDDSGSGGEFNDDFSNDFWI